MARFLAEVEGSGKPTHRLGSPASGIRAQAQGWDLGVKVYGNPKPLDEDRDMFEVFITGGSNGGFTSFKIGTAQRTSGGDVIFTLSDEMAAKLHCQYQTAQVSPVELMHA